MAVIGQDLNHLSLQDSLLRRIVKSLSILAVIAALGYILILIVLFVIRMVYPFELEWIEGAYVDEMRWIAQGKSPYPDPSIFFIPTSKTPLFFYLSAGLMKLVGEGFIAPRLISVLATIGCFVLLYLLVKLETGVVSAGIVAAGIYAASYRFAGAWMDLAKTDSMFLFFVLAAFYLFYKYPGRWGMIIGGIFFVLAYYTKQMALPIILALAPISLLVTRARSWLLWLTVLVFGFGAFALLEWLSEGWFSFYTLETVTRHDRIPDWFLFWNTFSAKYWPSLLLALVYFGFILKRTNLREWKLPEEPWQLIGLGIATIAASWSIFLKTWTYDNGYLPACLGVALLAGLATGSQFHSEGGFLRSSILRPAFQIAVWGFVLIQLLSLWYDPKAQIPARQDRQTAEAFIARLNSLPGEVLVFNHGYVNHLAGKTTYLHSAPYGDVAGGSLPPTGTDSYRRRAQVIGVFDQAVMEQRFDWVIVDRPDSSWFPHYLFVDRLFDDPQALFPVTGAPARPESLMVKNPVAHGGTFPLDAQSLEPFFVIGWSPSQEGGRWVLGAQSLLQVSFEEDHNYQGRIESVPMCLGDLPRVASIEIGWNDQILATGDYLGCGSRTHAFIIPSSSVKPGFNDLLLRFIPANDSSPLRIDSNEPVARISAIHFNQN